MEISNLIAGVYEVGEGDELITFNPSTEQQLATMREASRDQVNRAVTAARTAAPSWRKIGFEGRKAKLAEVRAELGERRETLIDATMKNVGTPRRIADAVQVGVPLQIFDTLLELTAEECEPEVTVGNSLIVSEPIGVVGAITPWNYPIYMVISKIVPALLAGNTIVLKPSELAPLPVHELASAFSGALPPGVLSVLWGTGPSVGEALVDHPDVDMISFTGSTAAGKRISEVAARTLKKVATELGGKGANILLPGLDLAKAVKSAVNNCYLNSGQTCLALTRLLVHKSEYDEAVKVAAEVAESFTVGDPLTSGAKLGPMVTAAHRERVLGMIQNGIDEGARVVAGGVGTPAGVDSGYFVRPTVFADVTSEMSIAQNEIFGPVLVVMSYENPDDAVRIANGTVYGLTAGVRGPDQEAALRVARELEAGQVEVNGGAYNPAAPFGGVKQSGNGRELGLYGVREFYEIKSIQL